MTYGPEFYEEEGRVAHNSAFVVLPWLFAEYPEIRTVVDVGCGTGRWAQIASWSRTAVGVDYGVPKHLQAQPLVEVDLSDNGYDCVGYDLAICLEVAEHLPESAAYRLVSGLARARMVLFSAATPGQPGVGHINCQPHDYWHALFAEHGKTPRFIGDQFDEPVADFYRRNMYVYT